MKKIDDHLYWTNRHSESDGKVAAVGIKSFTEEANYYVYKIVKEQYFKILNLLHLPSDAKFLDAGSGIGIFSNFLLELGFNITAVDINSEVLKHIKNPLIKKVTSYLHNLDFPENSFDVVHSFDVLYHILDNKEWETTLQNFCRISNKYIILHERFLSSRPWIVSDHIKFRSYQETLDVLNANNFQEVLSIPTHLFALRNYVYKITAYFQKQFYKLDRFCLDKIENTPLNKFGSHHIKVFKKLN